MRWSKLWLRRLRPRTTEGYVGLCVAVFSTATQVTLVAALKDDSGEFLLVVPGALASWLLAFIIVAIVDLRRYRGLRDDWQEVRMFYSPTFGGRGLGDVYPREPTLLLHPPMMWNPDLKKTHDRPVEIWFNDGYVGAPETPTSPFHNGTWGPMDLIYPGPVPSIRQVGIAHTRILQQNWIPSEPDERSQRGADSPD